MNKSTTLGFYVRNHEAMDAIFDCEVESRALFTASAREQGLKEDLLNVVLENWETMTWITGQLEKDVAQFEVCIRDGLRLGLKNAACVKPTRKPYWGGRIRITHTDGRTARTLHDAELGWTFGSRNQSVLIRPWIWARGGRATEQTIIELMQKWMPSLKPVKAEVLGEGWVSGTVVLAQINCGLGRYLGKPIDGIDTELLGEDVLAAFHWINKARINKILRLGLKRKL